METDPHSDALEHVPAEPVDAGAGGATDDDAALAAAADTAGATGGGTGGAGPTGAGVTGPAGEGPTGATGPSEPTIGEVVASIGDLAAQVKAIAINAQAMQAAPAAEKEPEKVEMEPFDFSGIVTDEMFENIASDKARFIDILNKVAAAAANKAVEHSARTVPVIAAGEVTRSMTAVGDVKAFYTKNKDLLSFRPTVRAVFDALVVENPGMATTDIFEKRLAPAVRVRLGLKAPAPGKKKDTARPRVAPGTGGRKPVGGALTPSAEFEDSLKKMGG